MIFLQRVLDLIASAGITKNKLSTDTGINKNSFVDWERRGTIPGGDVVTKIADYFHVSTDYLLGRTDDKAPTSVSGDGLDAEQADLVRLYKNASPALRAAALAVLKSAEGQGKAPGGVSEAE